MVFTSQKSTALVVTHRQLLYMVAPGNVEDVLVGAYIDCPSKLIRTRRGRYSLSISHSCCVVCASVERRRSSGSSSSLVVHGHHMLHVLYCSHPHRPNQGTTVRRGGGGERYAKTRRHTDNTLHTILQALRPVRPAEAHRTVIGTSRGHWRRTFPPGSRAY